MGLTKQGVFPGCGGEGIGVYLKEKMWLSHIQIKNINGFSDTGLLQLSRHINILVGQNNTGKSTFISSILTLQHPSLAKLSRKISSNGYSGIHIYREDWPNMGATPDLNAIRITHQKQIKLTNRGRFSGAPVSNVQGDRDITSFPDNEPQNILYPYLSHRKVNQYNESFNNNTVNAISGRLDNLYPKISRLCNRFHSGHELYFNATQEIFGYPISTIETNQGLIAAYQINDVNHIPITSMGDGVSNLLGLIVDLCVATNKIFLIEELENDIHPKAIKALLKLIKQKSINNQFFISTHSNVVLKELGAQNTSKIFQVSMSINSETKVPDSNVKEIGISKSDRIAVLEDLGYEFQDFELWHGWLFLEESSAERIIREYFIKWYTPKLIGRLKTFSAKSKDEVKPKFDNFNSLFVFLHLEPTYKNKAWVVIDAGEDEKKIIDKMKDFYVNENDWDENKFRQWDKQNFEEYYPPLFKPLEVIQEVLNIQDKQQKRAAKKDLLDNLVDWIDEDEERAQQAFETSAKEVVDILREIESEIIKM